MNELVNSLNDALTAIGRSSALLENQAPTCGRVEMQLRLNDAHRMVSRALLQARINEGEAQ
jgi:hypothetical protein